MSRTVCWSATSLPARSRACTRRTCPVSCARSRPACSALQRAGEPGFYDVMHSHYWLSGQFGFLVQDRWGIPLVHSAHTLARVKNAALADSDEPEPPGRLIGEDQVVAEADRLIANTDDEARALIELYDADPDRLDVVAPGVDTEVFAPGDRAAARAALGVPAGERLIVFAGRIQPLKAPDVLSRALGVLRRRFPDEPWRLSVVGGLSGTGRRRRTDWPHWPSTTVSPTWSSSGRRRPRPTWPGLPGRRRGRGAQPQRVVRAGRLGGAGCGYPGGGGGRRRPGGRGQGWGLRRAGTRARRRSLGRRAVERRSCTGSAGRPCRGARAHAVKFSWDVTVDGLLASYRKAAAGLRPQAAELAR